MLEDVKTWGMMEEMCVLQMVFEAFIDAIIAILFYFILQFKWTKPENKAAPEQVLDKLDYRSYKLTLTVKLSSQLINLRMKTGP